MMKMMKKRWGYVISLYEILHYLVNHITKMSFFFWGGGGRWLARESPSAAEGSGR